MALLAFSTEPVMATRFAWWHLRTWSGQYYFVHPDGWFEELEPWELVAIEFAFATEPAMAVYVDAVSHMMTPSQEWPPVWNADLQIWQTSREEPGRGSTVAQPLDLDRLWHSQQQPATGSAWNQPAAWNQPGTGSAWNHQPGRGYARSSWEPGQGYWEPGQGSWGSSSGPSSSSTGCAGGREPEQPWRWRAEEGWYQPYVGDKKPRPDFEAPRFGTRGFGSSCRRMERRWLHRRGEETPDHLKPVKAKMTKEVKTKMKELIKQMRDIDEASSESELPEVPKPEKAPDTDTESSSSFDFRGGEGNAKARDGSRKRVWKGTPSNAAKLSLVPEEPAKAVEPKVEEEEDEDEDMGDGKEEPAEAGKKKKQKQRRKSKRNKKEKD